MRKMVSFIERKKYLFLFLIIFLGAFLRLYKVPAVPPGLYIDEISDAYNGYEILTKGVDEHDVRYPLWFQAFGEYKMPTFVYGAAAGIAIFGRTDFAVRSPSIFSGIFSLLIFYFLVENLAKFGKKYLPFAPPVFALTATFFLAISPWHIQFSRAGFDATIALFFYLLGLLCAVLAYKKQKTFLLIFSFLFLGLTIYSYNAYRLAVPITFLAITGLFFLKQKRMLKGIITSAIFFLVLITPVIIFTFTGAGVERFAETSAFSSFANLSIIQKAIKFPIIFLNNYLSYFSLNFLFNVGDGIGRHQMVNFGPVSYWQFPFLLIGLFFFIKNWRSPFYQVAFLLLFLAPFSGAFTTPSPHTLRSLLLVVPLSVIAAYGFLWAMAKLLKGKRVLMALVIVMLIAYEFLFYLHFYYQHYPIINSIDWGGGYEQVVAKAVVYKSKFQHIVVDMNLGDFRSTPLYFGFYSGDTVKPLVVPVNWQKPKNWPKGTTLFIRPHYPGQEGVEVIDRVYLPGQRDVFAEFWKL